METKKTILVVEDEKSLRQAIVDSLKLKNYLCLEAGDGKEALDIALVKHPDLILLDLLLPVFNGMTVLKKIRKDQWGEQVPIIILTNLSATDVDLVEGMVKYKPTYYLVKSDWKIKDIIKKIQKILS